MLDARQIRRLQGQALAALGASMPKAARRPCPKEPDCKRGAGHEGYCNAYQCQRLDACGRADGHPGVCSPTF